jgi:DNA-binding response OmpR family regulator
MRDRPIVLVAARPVVRRLVTAALDPAGFRVATQSDSRSLADSIAELRPDVLMVEGDAATRSGAGEPYRQSGGGRPVPLIVMSADATPAGARSALDAGADDYVVRPFDPSELAARVRSLMRRRGERLASGTRLLGNATVDLARRQVSVGGQRFTLSRTEWRLLLRLMADEERIVSADDLIQAAFGWEARGDTGALRGAIGRLRRKLGTPAGEEGPIRSVRGFGYSLDSRPEEPAQPRGQAQPSST